MATAARSGQHGVCVHSLPGHHLFEAGERFLTQAATVREADWPIIPGGGC
jgi:hypothetical protein